MTKRKLKAYINKNNLFQNGTDEQFERLQTLPLHDIATCIWILSDTDKHVTEIEHDLVGGDSIDW